MCSACYSRKGKRKYEGGEVKNGTTLFLWQPRDFMLAGFR